MKILLASTLVIIMLAALAVQGCNYVFVKKPNKFQTNLYNTCNKIYVICLILLGLVVIAASIIRKMHGA